MNFLSHGTGYTAEIAWPFLVCLLLDSATMLSHSNWTTTLRHGLVAASVSLAMLAVSSLSFAQAPAAGACQKDTDCKGDRVCASGKCVEGTPAPAAPPASGPPPGVPGSRGSYYDYKVQVAQDPRLIQDWQEGDPMPEGYVKTTRMRTKLIGGGAGLLGGLWIASIISGAVIWEGEKVQRCDYYATSLACDTSVTHRHWGLFIPVLGPFIDIGTTQDRNAIGVVVDVIDGLGQAGGLAMLVIGIAVPKTVLVRAAGIEMKPMPLLAKGVAGLGLTGTF